MRIPTNKTPKWGHMAFMASFLKERIPLVTVTGPPGTLWQTSCPGRSLAEDGEILWAALVGDRVLILPVHFLEVHGGIKTDGGENET